MFDERFYTDTYDLYRPTEAKSASYTQTLTLPVTATSTGHKCRFFPRPGRLNPGEQGLALDYDGVLYYPPSQGLLRPAGRGQLPDTLSVNTVRYMVVASYAAAGLTFYNKAYVRQER